MLLLDKKPRESGLPSDDVNFRIDLTVLFVSGFIFSPKALLNVLCSRLEHFDPICTTISAISSIGCEQTSLLSNVYRVNKGFL